MSKEEKTAYNVKQNKILSNKKVNNTLIYIAIIAYFVFAYIGGTSWLN